MERSERSRCYLALVKNKIRLRKDIEPRPIVFVYIVLFQKKSPRKSPDDSVL